MLASLSILSRQTHRSSWSTHGRHCQSRLLVFSRPVFHIVGLGLANKLRHKNITDTIIQSISILSFATLKMSLMMMMMMMTKQVNRIFH